MKDRIILHVDHNSFYASVEQSEHPELRGKPIAVAGKQELRHGIILTRSTEAKKFGVKTAEAIWEARKKCPDLIVVPPDYRLYQHYSRLSRGIFYEYSDLVEPFGLDESWIDITGSLALHGGSAIRVAKEISERVKAELGCTVSIGLSWNKIFAKFGSDYQKPDAITVIGRDNYQDIVWESPVEDLLYVGQATKRKLNGYAINTVGDLAHASDTYLKRRLGVMGATLKVFARGEDTTPVKALDPDTMNAGRSIKSYGNGLTAPHDILNASDAKALLYILAEAVTQRMRIDMVCCGCVSIGVRYGDDLTGYTRQTRLLHPSAATGTVSKTAWKLLQENEPFNGRPLRALHVRASDLSPISDDRQLCLFSQPEDDILRLDFVIDDLRRRFGNTIVRRGIESTDTSIDGLDIKAENTVHPVSYFHA